MRLQLSVKPGRVANILIKLIIAVNIKIKIKMEI